jgi:hypothetical protein
MSSGLQILETCLYVDDLAAAETFYQEDPVCQPVMLRDAARQGDPNRAMWSIAPAHRGRDT